MTKFENFTLIENAIPTTHPDYETIMAFIAHEKELLESKRGSLKKPTAEQEANKVLIKEVLAVMREANKAMTISEILAYGGERLAGIKSNQHMNSLLIKMRASGDIERIYDKKTAKFQVAGTSPAEPETEPAE